LYLNTVGCKPVSVSLAHLITTDMDTRTITEEQAAAKWEGLEEFMVGKLHTPDPRPTIPSSCLDCLVWLQKELLAVLDDVLGTQQQGQQQ
jgi:hypothetical protein